MARLDPDEVLANEGNLERVHELLTDQGFEDWEALVAVVRFVLTKIVEAELDERKKRKHK